jgi:PAS domain S-box-containing protein
MKPLRPMNIGDKLALALGCSALLILTATGIALTLFGRVTLADRATQIMQPYARLVSVGAETAVVFEDPLRAREILGTLRANPQIVSAEIVLRDGRQLAGYGNAEGVGAVVRPLGDDGVHLTAGSAELIQSLHDGARLRLVMGLDELNRQTRNLLLLFGGSLLTLVAAITFGLRVALQRMIVGPVSILAGRVEQVRARADYHQRVSTSGTDEVGRLGESFNAMLEAIQEREADLRRLNLFQRSILDNAAYGIIATDARGVVSSFNRAAEHLLGYTADEVVGKMMPTDWHDREEMAQRALKLSEELGEAVAPGFAVFTARLRHGLPEEREWTFIRKDGVRVPALLSVTPLRGADGQITGFLGLTYDLTERKQADEARRQSEARYRRIVDTAIEGVCSIGRDAAISFVNARMAEMLGCSCTEMLGRPLSDFMFAEDVPDHLTKLEDRRRGLSGNYERRFRRKNGEVVWTLVSASPVFDDKEVFLGSFAMFSDITKRKLAEEDLRRLKDELELRVRERTAELATKNEELERVNRLFVGRELHMVELKERLRKFEQPNREAEPSSTP